MGNWFALIELTCSLAAGQANLCKTEVILDNFNINQIKKILKSFMIVSELEATIINDF